MDINLMKAAFPLLANLLADELGLDVVWIAGQPPHADRSKNRIVLPPDVDPIAALGLLIHEAGHFKFTNFAEWSLRVANNKTRHAFGNAIEDIWMEHAVIQMYPGARKRLNDLIIALQNQGRIKNGRHPVIDYFHTKLRSDYLQQSIDEALLLEAEAIFVETFGEEKKSELDELLKDIRNVSSTRQAFDMSEAIIALFESDDKSDDEPESGESGEGESESGQSDKGESGEGESESGQSDKGESGEGESESGQSDKGESGKKTGKGSSGAGVNAGAEEDFTFQGIGEMVLEAIEEAVEAAAAKVASNGNNLGAEALAYEGEMYEIPAVYEKGFTPKVSPPAETSALRRGLSALLQGETLVKQRPALVGNKIVPTKLWSVKYGGRAFKNVTQGVKRNAAIHITLDVSGSMSGTPIEVAKKAVISVAAAVDKTAGVDVVVSTFSNGMTVLNTPSAIQKAVATGGTAMAPAIKTAGMQLARSIKDNKILIVVTDGEPHQPAWTRRMIEACQAVGITVVGIGIGDMAVKELFDNHIVIQNVSELPRTLLGCLKNIL